MSISRAGIDLARRAVLLWGASLPLLAVAAKAGYPQSASNRVFCLVHGSTQGPGGWDLLSEKLRRQGHRVIAPRIPLDDPAASAADCARAVTDALSADHSLTTVKIVVVAHSISGLFLPQVVTYGRVSQLVYLAAAVPKPGMSFRQQFDASPDMYNAEWIAMGAKISSDERVATHFLYHDCSPAVIRKALAERIEFRASKLWTEPFALAEHPAIDTRYIVCGLDRTFTPTWMKRAARQTLAVEPLEMRTGHCPYLSKPQALASLLALGGEHSRIRPTKVSHDQ